MSRLAAIREFLSRRPVLYTGVALVALYVAVVSLKLYHWPPDMYLASDPAFRFRYVRMYALGEEIPALDRAAQWPEGVDVRRAFFLTQDAFIGVSYRILRPLLGEMQPQNFLRWHVSLWSSLTLFLVYLWGRRTFRSRPGGLLAALVYGLSLVIYLRTCGNYLREDFVLPVFFFALYCQTRLVEGGSWRWIPPAVAAFALALISWHASSFLYFFATLPLAATVLVSKDSRGVGRAAAALGAAALVAYIHPALREKVFLASPSFALACAVAATALAAWKWRLKWWQRLVALGVIFGVAYGAGRPFAAAGEYSHIYTMIFYKIRYMGVKPADPNLLPLAAREIWTGPANSPTWASAAAVLVLPLVIALPPLVKYVKEFLRGLRDPAAGAFGAATIVFSVVFALLFSGYTRFMVVLAFFVAAWAAGYAGLARPGRRALAWLLIPAVLLPFEGIKAARYESRPQPWTALLEAAASGEGGYASNVGDEEWRIIRWFGFQPDRTETAVLGPFPASAALLAFAGTPIVLHPIYEAPGMRAKVNECYQALYGDEEGFYGVCEKYDVTYVAYHAAYIVKNDPDSMRYARAITRVRADSCAYKMQFEPAELEHFAPVFETVSWRVFLVGVPGREGPDLGPPSPLFAGPAEKDGYYDEDFSVKVYEDIDRALEYYNAGVEHYQAKEMDAGRENFIRALELCPRLVGAWDGLTWLELESGNAAAGAYAAEQALALDPYDDAAHAAFAALRGDR
ncbi:MAG: hypothetical protein PVH29_06840 [Candidatus Zixiibacteriota bacterium]